MSSIGEKVKNGGITYCCVRCAKEYGTKTPYEGTYIFRKGECQICGEVASITSARKLFGYHKFV